MPELLADRPGRRAASALRARGLPRPSATIALALLMAAAAVLLMYVGRRLTFFYDEWDFILNRRGSSVGAYLDPHNGHLSLFPVLVYKVLFATVGLHHYWPYRLVAVALHLLCAWLLYVLCRRRIGPVGALLPAGLLLFLGTAWQDLLWPFQIGYFGSIAGGLGALAVLDADPPVRRSWAAAALLTWSISSSSVGIPFLLAAAALMLMRRAPWRQFWVLAVPAILYLIWYAGWGGGEQTTRAAILGAPGYVASAASGAVAGIAGLDPTAWGAALTVALIAWMVIAWRARGTAAPTPMLVAPLVGALVFWVLTAVVRAGPAEPAASRYVYVGAVFILLLIAEAGQGLHWRGPWLSLAALALIGIFVANLNALRGGEGGLRFSDDSVRASFAAVQIAGPLVPDSFRPDPNNAPDVSAGGYLRAEHDLGSMAPTAGQLQRSPSSVQSRADTVLSLAESAKPSDQHGLLPAPIKVEALFGAGSTPSGACLQVTPHAPALASLDVTVPTGMSISIQPRPGATANVYVRRFAPSFTPPTFTTVTGGASATVGFPRDLAAQIPWHIQVVDPVGFKVCPS